MFKSITIIGEKESGKTLVIKDIYDNSLKYTTDPVFVFNDKKEIVTIGKDKQINQEELYDLLSHDIDEQITVIIDSADNLNQELIANAQKRDNINLIISYNEETIENSIIIENSEKIKRLSYCA